MDSKSLHIRFTTCYETEADALFRFCITRVSNREQALDITQETFTRLWQTLIEGKEVHNERALLFAIAHNSIIDWYRKKKAISLEGMANPEDEAPYEPSDGKAYADFEAEAEGRYLVEMIRQIPDHNRDAVYLRFVEGMAPAEIGDILGISANAASVRVNRGLEELRRLSGHSLDSNLKIP